MTENNKNQIDLEEEIASLDEFLNEDSSNEAEAFPLDDDSDFESFDTEPARKSKGKLLGTVALLALLGGGIYAGMKYLPQMMNNPTLSDFEQNMMSRADSFSDTLVAAQPVVEPTSMNEPLPMAADMVMDDTMPVPDVEVEKDLSISDVEVTIVQEGEALPDDIVTLMDEDNNASAFGDGLAEGMPAAPVEDVVAVVETQTATSIAEIVEIAEEATENAIPENMNEEVMVVKDITANEEVLPPVVDNTSFGDTTSFERIEAQPFKATVMAEREAAAMEKAIVEPVIPVTPAVEDVIATETEIMEPVVSTVVDTVAEPVVEDIVEAAVAEEIVVVEPEIAQVPRVPEVVEPKVEVEKAVEPVVQAEPVKKAVKKSVPKKTVKKTPPKKTDPRVTQARKAYETEQFQRALTLYEAVLASDVGNTAALTGRQLAKAKLRAADPAGKLLSMEEKAVPTPTVVQTTPQGQILQAPVQPKAPVVTQPDPRDAKAALKMAQQYQASGQNTKAVEWYRKALQLDAIYSANINRMAVYDALADMQ